VTSRVVVSRLCARPNDVQLGGGEEQKKPFCARAKNLLCCCQIAYFFFKTIFNWLNQPHPPSPSPQMERERCFSAKSNFLFFQMSGRISLDKMELLT